MWALDDLLRTIKLARGREGDPTYTAAIVSRYHELHDVADALKKSLPVFARAE